MSHDKLVYRNKKGTNMTLILFLSFLPFILVRIFWLEDIFYWSPMHSIAAAAILERGKNVTQHYLMKTLWNGWLMTAIDVIVVSSIFVASPFGVYFFPEWEEKIIKWWKREREKGRRGEGEDIRYSFVLFSEPFLFRFGFIRIKLIFT